MVFKRGQKIIVECRSKDEQWEGYMDEYIGCKGVVTDPDSTINDPDALIEISLDGKGTIRLPQDCLKPLEN